MSKTDIPNYSYLIIDDDKVTCALIKSLLSRQGASGIEVADNGKTAMKLIKAASRFPDIIICDLNMPDMDGVEFVQYLAHEYFTGGLILTSGSAQNMLNAVRRFGQAWFLNILATLPKPFEPEALLECLARYDKDHRASTPQGH